MADIVQVTGFILSSMPVGECFFGTLKSECFYLDEFSNISELKDAVTEYGLLSFQSLFGVLLVSCVHIPRL